MAPKRAVPWARPRTSPGVLLPALELVGRTRPLFFCKRYMRHPQLTQAALINSQRREWIRKNYYSRARALGVSFVFIDSSVIETVIRSVRLRHSDHHKVPDHANRIESRPFPRIAI